VRRLCFFLVILMIDCTLIYSFEVQLKDWSYGPDIDRPYIVKSRNNALSTVSKPFNIEVYSDLVWFSKDNLLLYQSGNSGRIYEFIRKDTWYKIFDKFKNSYYEEHAPSPLNVSLYSVLDSDTYYYEALPYHTDAAKGEYYSLEKNDKHFFAREISENQFASSQKKVLGQIGINVPRGSYSDISDLRIDIDFEYYIFLEVEDYAESNESRFMIKNRYNQIVFNLSQQILGQTTGSPYLLPERCVAVNSNQNTIAVLLACFPKVNEESMVVLTILYDGKINSSHVRLRDSPDLNSKILLYLDNGDDIKIIDRSPEKEVIDSMNSYWYKIQLPSGSIGWVYGSFITVE